MSVHLTAWMLEMLTGQSWPPASQGCGWDGAACGLCEAWPRSCPGLSCCPWGSSESQVGTGTCWAPE